MAGIFNFPVDYGSGADVEARVAKPKFGDGYTQRIPDGLNSVAEKHEVTLTLQPKATALQIRDFFLAHKGAEPFTWVTPLGDSKLFICEKWKITPTAYNLFTVTATFEEWFGS